MSTTKTNLIVEDYRVLFEREDFPASGTSCLCHNGVLSLSIQKASDGARGLGEFLTHSEDMGNTWSEPEPFGPPLMDPEVEFQGLSLAYATADGTQIAVGHYLPHGIREGHHGEDKQWRPGDMLVGRKPAGAAAFEWTRYASGTFLGEQFVAPGIMARSGRLVLTIWGAKQRGENWRCGVLLSDDGGQTFRYRDVAYEADRAIRNVAEMPAGYNEQTLFETLDGTLVSIIRGRDAIGAIPGSSPRCSEALFSRSVSTDGGETWSNPQLTNLPGTGAPADGLTLPDGSLLLPARVPTVWSRHDDYSLCGLHMARSFDEGQTWETERVFHRDPAGNLYDNYYNAMNGTFVRLDDERAMYVFGHFDRKRERHRVNAVVLSWS
jgi:hypothetical protein